MADSTVGTVGVDLSKMKVVDLRKELKTRGLSAEGDKAELLERLQAAMSQASDSNDEHGDINLDSDIDSDGVLEDEDDKSQGDILDDSAVDTLNEELALAEQPAKSESKPQRILKRKITASDTSKTKADDDKTDSKTGAKEPATKKIVLNRTISTSSTKPTEDKVDDKTIETSTAKSNKTRITVDVDSKSKLELRAKRFGLPVQMSEDEKREARKKRFGQGSADSTTSNSTSSATPGSLDENIDKLRKRAERFGQSVSQIMIDIENKEKLEKRKAKFAAV